jgi:SAM-dependent methyltransferase
VRCLESPDAADWILNNPEINVATLKDKEVSQWPFEDELFDLIIFWHVLEHLPSPITSLSEAFRCLTPGGAVYISTPNITSWQARMNLTGWFHLDVPRHLHHFSKNGLISILNRTGFTPGKCLAGDKLQNLFGWLQSIANLFTPRHLNAIYRLIQGGQPLGKIDYNSLIIQVLTSWIWIPAGSIGFLIETLLGNFGTITFLAHKQGESYNKTNNHCV